MYNEFVQVMEKESTNRSHTRINIEKIERIRRKSDELGLEKELFEAPSHTVWKLRMQGQFMPQNHGQGFIQQ
jgi:hypothetical protein